MEENTTDGAMEAAELRAIIVRAKEGEKEAFGVLYSRFFTPLYRYVLYRVGSRGDAEELTQEVFLKAYAAFGRYDADRATTPLPYFFTIARNAIIDWRRKQRTLVLEPDLMHTFSDDQPLPDGVAIRAEDANALYRALDKLSEDMREALLLRFMGGLSGREVADQMGKSEDAIRQLQSRAMRILKEKLGEIK